MYILAFDHRRQLEEMVIGVDDPGPNISRFKSLVCDAVLRVQGDSETPDRIGIIVDQRYGENVLNRMSAQQFWIGRPVEIPGSCPVEFDPRNSMGTSLLSWPDNHVVKCLVFYHPDDEMDLRLEQEHRIQELYADCVALDRELLLEVIVTSRGQACEDQTVANVLRRFYNLGVFPAWWKLETQSVQGWKNISEVINRYDPLCHGVLLLGLDAPEEQLAENFRIAAAFPLCRGFAVGRSIFGEAARAWFQGDLDDEGVLAKIADNYQRIIAIWQRAVAVNGDRA